MKKYIVANWKMHGDLTFCHHYLKSIVPCLSDQVRVVLCPPFPYLSAFEEAPFSLGAQNCHVAQEGAFTGEVSATMLRDLGCQYVILGHSERRQHGESDQDVAMKVLAAQRVGLIPIVCVGETQEQRQQGQTQSTIASQLESSLNSAVLENLIIAYEPIWAIGTGLIPALQDIVNVHRFIHQHLPRNPILYGGSVKSSNAAEILSLPEVNGVLVGGASLDVVEFGRIIVGKEM